MDYNLNFHFCLKSSKRNLKGQAPVYLRITLNGKRSEFTTNQSIVPDNWNRYTERAKGNREEARTINNYLSSLSKRFTDISEAEL